MAMAVNPHFTVAFRASKANPPKTTVSPFVRLSATEAGENAGAAGHPPAPRVAAGRAAPLPAPFHQQYPSPTANPYAAPTTPLNPTPTPPPPPALATQPSSSSSTRPPHPWEITARGWLESFPDGRPPTEPEVGAYIDAHRPELPSLPRSQRLLALRGDQVLDADQSAFPYRFQRTDLWKPVFQWLETLEMDSLVESKQISDWLAANPQIVGDGCVLLSHGPGSCCVCICRDTTGGGAFSPAAANVRRGPGREIAPSRLQMLHHTYSSDEFILDSLIPEDAGEMHGWCAC